MLNGKNGFFDALVDFDPAAAGEGFDDFVLRADQEDVDHVAWIAFFIGNAARDFGEKVRGDSGNA